MESFESISQQVSKIVGNISNRVNVLETVKLSLNLNSDERDGRDFDNNDLSCRNYFSFLKTQLDNQYEILTRKYSSIGQQLLKLESIIFRTNTGCRPEMKGYYRMWEKRIFKAVINNICQSFRRLIAALKEPKFNLTAILTGSDVMLSPTASELYKEVKQFVIAMLDGTRGYVRLQISLLL